MLQAGYAIAGATPTAAGVGRRRPGHSRPRNCTSTSRDKIGHPNRVYVWGESTGGLASARLAELHPNWVAGSLAMCAPLSGPVRSYDLSLDVAYAIRQLLEPKLKVVGYTSADEARRDQPPPWRPLRMLPLGAATEQAKVAFIAGHGRAAERQPDHDRRDLARASSPANVAAIRNLVDQTTLQRFELEQRSGGNFSGNAGTDYSLRVTGAQRQQFDGIEAGLTDTMLAVLANGSRITPDPRRSRRRPSRAPRADRSRPRWSP